MIIAAIDRLVRAVFFHRVLRLIADEAISEALRSAARNTARATALWTPLWPQTRGKPRQQAVLELAFVLACDAEGLDIREAASRVAMSADPARGMQRFLAERRHLRFADLQLPRWATGEARGR